MNEQQQKKPQEQQAQSQDAKQEAVVQPKSISIPGPTPRAQEFTYVPMNPRRLICAKVDEVTDNGAPPFAVYAALCQYPAPIPIDPPSNIEGPGLISTLGVKNGSLYEWINDPTTNNSAGERIRTTVPYGGSGIFWFAVWFRNGSGTYYVEARKVTITHNPQNNLCDPH